MIEDISEMLLSSRIYELSKEINNEDARDEIEYGAGNTRFVPIKITKEEFEKTLRYQKVMLHFMCKQYKKAIGTENEAQARKLYNDSLIDYDDFIKQHARYFLESL